MADQSEEREITIQITEPLCAVFRRHLKGLGQKYTPERAQILETLIEMDDLFQVDDVMDRLKATDSRVSKATVYRTVKLLQDAGIIQQVLLVDAEQAHFQLAYGKRARDLIVNRDTNEIEAIDLSELTELLGRVCRQRGLAVESRRLVVYARSL